MLDSSHPENSERAAWVTDLTGSAEPFDPAFADIPAVNRALTEHF
ncbi:hypothetical protein OUO20_18140 [Arthrobacter sp. FX8]|nr:hypothetical protein [Arthrobacter sp. FX8]WAJ32956.1 hypothetical protein OUO20_18140 [Arthrobacter sp. FX8]